MESPYFGFNHLCCEQAVRNILQDLRRRRRKMNNNLKEHYYHYEDFFLTSQEHIDTVMKEPSIQNIDRAYEYINIEKHYTKGRKAIP